MLGQYVTTGYVMAIADTPIHLDLTKAIATVPVFLHAPEIAFNAISHLLLLHAWNPFYLTFNTPSWSISALIFFYLCFVYIGKYISQIKYPLLGLITLNLIYLIPPLIFIINDNYGAIATGLLHTNPLFRLPEFLSGVMLCFWLQKANYFEFKKIKFFTITISLLSILIVSVYLLLINGPAGFYLAHNGFLLPLELAIVVIFAKMPPLNGAWLNRLVDRLGNATLSIFILHMPLFYFFSHLEELIKVYLKDSSLNQLSKQMKEVEPSIALYPLIILIIVVISVVVQERFVLKIRPSLQKKCKPIISRWLSVVQNLPMGRGGK
jgi:peptidoglycan/LPS O-acetylase OafA/YrhL